MDSVLKEFDRLSRSKGFAKCEAQIDMFLDTLEQAKMAISSGMATDNPIEKLAHQIDPSNMPQYVKKMRDQLSAISSKITESEKEIYSGISKYSKSLDKVGEQ